MLVYLTPDGRAKGYARHQHLRALPRDAVAPRRKNVSFHAARAKITVGERCPDNSYKAKSPPNAVGFCASTARVQVPKNSGGL